MTLPSAANIPQLFLERVRRSGASPAIRFKRNGVFVSRTWNEICDDVWRFAAALGMAGVDAGARVLQVSENRYEWILADLAIQCLQAIHVPAHAPLTGHQLAYQINDSGARVVLISNRQQAEKLAQVDGTFSQPLTVIAYEPCDVPIGGSIPSSLEVRSRDASLACGRELAQRAARETSPETIATILYTSGTTGEPKGVMLNQRNLVGNALAATQSLSQHRGDMRLCFLPLSHIFARTCDLYSWIVSGSGLGLAESRETVFRDCQEIRPTLLNGVPYFFDRLRRALLEEGMADQPNRPREMLGGRIRFCCSGGAALPDHVFDFFHERGLKVLQGYGLTESSPVISLSTETHYRRSAVGRCIENVTIRIADDGEVLARGPNIMVGYWNKPDATAETVRNGWLHTGDLGRIDEDGYLSLTGRKKELIVTAGGKNIAPVLLESMLTEDPLIHQALIVGDGRNYLAALIVPNGGALQAELSQMGLSGLDDREARAHPQVISLFASRIADRLRTMSSYEQVRKFALLERPFSLENGELTPKLSLRRGVIEANFADAIRALYGLP